MAYKATVRKRISSCCNASATPRYGVDWATPSSGVVVCFFICDRCHSFCDVLPTGKPPSTGQRKG